MTWKFEWNGGKMTERDQKLLVLLAIVVVIAVAGLRIVRPLVKQIQADREEIEVQEELKIVNDNKIMVLPSLRTQVRNNRENFANSVEDFFPRMESDEVGKYLTNMALDYGLAALNMTIRMPDKPTFINPYKGAELDLTSGEAMSPAIYTANVAFQVQGDGATLQRLLDHLLKEETSLLITGFTWGEQIYMYDGEPVTVRTLQLQICVYMVDKEAARSSEE